MPGGEAGTGSNCFVFSMTRTVSRHRAEVLAATLAPVALAILGAPSFAQTAQPALKETVITATRTATRADELVSDVTVIDRAQIESSTARTLPELLARQAGVQVAATGGRGATSSVFIRGAETRHTIVLVDGVRIGSATAGTPNWEAIPVELIERIEVLKGPASALYGSDGVAGVVQIFTRRGREGFHPFASTTAGTYGYAAAAAGAEAGQGNWRYAFGVQRAREGRFNATNPRVPFGNHNPDRDPFEQDAANASFQWQATPDWRVDGSALYSDGVVAVDDGPGIDARSVIRTFTGQLGVKGRVVSGWSSELRVSRSEDASDSIRANFPGAFHTRQTQWTWQNDVDTPIGVAVAGLEQREQEVQATTLYTVTRRTIASAFAGLNGSAGAHTWQANLRRDHNSQFGNSDTGYAGYGWRITPNWRVHASHGTSFVAPSFNQLYFPVFGNPALQPEKGRNTDVGVTWTRGAHEVKLTRFDNRIRGFMTNTTLPVNVQRVRIDGWSLGYTGKVGDLALRAEAESLEPRNQVNGRLLPRRAREQAMLGADYTLGAWKFGGSLVHVGGRFDDTANTTPLRAYTTADLYLDWQFTRDFSVQAKLNNVANEHYETAAGYNQPGRAFYVTLRWQPK